MFTMPIYASPTPMYLWEDLKLTLGNERFKEFESWVKANVPASRWLKDGVAVGDVDNYFMSRRKLAMK